jgi:hypothetical protein
MKNFILLILLLILIGCNESENLYTNIIGCWLQNENENVDMIFTETGKLEYFGNEYLYNYEIENNKLSILDSNNVVLEFTIINLTKDSLILKKDDHKKVYKYLKLKEGCNGNLITPYSKNYN